MKPTRKYIVETKVCGTCVHYHQHYVLTEGGRQVSAARRRLPQVGGAGVSGGHSDEMNPSLPRVARSAGGV